MLGEGEEAAITHKSMTWRIAAQRASGATLTQTTVLRVLGSAGRRRLSSFVIDTDEEEVVLLVKIERDSLTKQHAQHRPKPRTDERIALFDPPSLFYSSATAFMEQRQLLSHARQQGFFKCLMTTDIFR